MLGRGCPWGHACQITDAYTKNITAMMTVNDENVLIFRQTMATRKYKTIFGIPRKSTIEI